MSLKRAFIFDLNGTMIDDMSYHLQVWASILNDDLGANLTIEERAERHDIGDLRLVVYGLALTLVVLFMPGGLVQAARLIRQKIFR